MSVRKSPNKRRIAPNLDPADFNVTAEQLDEIRQSFSAIDTNGDGRLSLHELVRAHHALGMNPTLEEMKLLLVECDVNNSGFIDFPEYVGLMAERLGVLAYEEEMMRAAFHHFDRDDSGYLSKDELRKYLTRCGDKLTDEEFQEVIKDVDKDGDGKIDINEFTQMLTKRK